MSTVSDLEISRGVGDCAERRPSNRSHAGASQAGQESRRSGPQGSQSTQPWRSVRDKKDLNLSAADGVACRESVIAQGHGRADYLLPRSTRRSSGYRTKECAEVGIMVRTIEVPLGVVPAGHLVRGPHGDTVALVASTARSSWDLRG